MPRTICLLLLTLGLACRPASAQAPFWPQWTVLPGIPAEIAAFTTANIGGGDDSGVVVALLAPPMRSADGGNTFLPVTGVDSDSPNQLVAAPSNPKVFYLVSDQPRVGIAQTRLYRSDDSGATWRRVPGTLALGDDGGADWIGQLSVDANPDVLYGVRMRPSLCFTGLCSYDSHEPFRSTDGGATWHSIGSGVTGSHVFVRAALASGGRVLYAGTSDGLFRSQDAAATWQKVRADPVAEIAVDRFDPLTVYLRSAAGGDILVTEDGGSSWRAAAALDLPGDFDAPHILPDPLDSGRVFYLGSAGRVFESTDRARSWKRVAGSLNGRLDTSVASIAAQGDARFLLAGTRRIEIRKDSYVLGSDLWWNPSESGRGLTITQHGNGKTFVAWYAYDAAGRQTWRVMPDGAWQDAKTLTGSLYETRGPDYFAGPFDASRVSAQAAGSATLHFDTDNSASFTYALNDGTQGTTSIVREAFWPAYGARTTFDYADLWWNAHESGWGLAVCQQFGLVFAAWFVYDASGHPQWVVMPRTGLSQLNLGASSDTTYVGDLYVTSGPPSTGPFDPSRVTATQVGSATLDFPTRDSATLTYTAFGVSGSRVLTRQPF
jgi:photosystem II stability/assembly factor-like uncharacterized protein